MGYLVCNKCKGHYELQEGENPDEFIDQCECGGTLKYFQNADEYVVDELGTMGGINFCPNCGTEIKENAKFCIKSGEMLDKSKLPHPDLEYNYARPFIRVILLFILTFGLYFFYWYYKNWKDLKKHRNMDIRPALRTLGLLVPLLGFYYLYVQFRDIKDFAVERGAEAYSSGLITVGFILISYVTSLLPDILWILGFLVLIPLLVVQRTLNNYWKTEQAGIPMKNKFSGAEIVIMIIGAFFWVLTIIGMFIPA